jgi:hypothetical protein
MDSLIKIFLIIFAIFVVIVFIFFGYTAFFAKEIKDGTITGKRIFPFTADEGKQFTGGLGNFSCKPGLKAIADANVFENTCAYPMCDCFVCTKCGDGVCGIGENHCNCPQDCKEDQGNKADLNDVFQPQFYKSDDFNGVLGK